MTKTSEPLPGASATSAPIDYSSPDLARRTQRRQGRWLQLVWPLAALGLLLLYNAFAMPSFFHLEIRDGRVVGNLIDVLNRGAPVMLLSLGMTLVIATAGIDLSVGAVMAIAGTVAAVLITRHDGSPLAVLGRGYALVKDETGNLISRAATIRAGQKLALRFEDGEVGCRAESRRRDTETQRQNER